MEKLKSHILNGSILGIMGTLGTMAFQHPDMLKEFGYFFLAVIFMHKGITANFQKITQSIDNLTNTMASLEKNHNERLTVVESGLTRLGDTVESIQKKIDSVAK